MERARQSTIKRLRFRVRMRAGRSKHLSRSYTVTWSLSTKKLAIARKQGQIDACLRELPFIVFICKIGASMLRDTLYIILYF